MHAFDFLLLSLTEYLDVRLSNPHQEDSIPTDGILQIKYRNVWSPVTFQLSSSTLRVICRSIGYESLRIFL